jgi:hypothetical protein
MVIERAKGLCERCGAKGFQVHHKTYAHRGQEDDHLEDLELLCIDCHAYHHGRSTAPGKMRPCFSCGSETDCQHREMDLLPPTPRKWQIGLLERKLMGSQQKQIERYQQQVAQQEALARLYEPNRTGLSKKPPGTAVDSSGNLKSGTKS